jgi:hypothetical protein
MMVELDNGMRFITNFRYNVKESIAPDLSELSQDQMDVLKTGD